MASPKMPWLYRSVGSGQPSGGDGVFGGLNDAVGEGVWLGPDRNLPQAALGKIELTGNGKIR